MAKCFFTTIFNEAMTHLFDSDIDFSFAICPRRRATDGYYCLGSKQQYIERTSFFEGFSIHDITEETADNDTSSVDSCSCRSVSFADNVVSEVRTVPRYEQESKSELFYNKIDMMRFRQEARLERMQVQVIW